MRGKRQGTRRFIENGARFIMRALKGGRPNGVKHAAKTGRNKGMATPLSKSRKKDMPRPASPSGRPAAAGNPPEIRRISAVRLLNARPVRDVPAYVEAGDAQT
ncbi:MAG: hypothetical protein LBD58_10505 [Treponema sp.]|nr:hypothetical protein [Treponema sp.]